MSEFLKVIVPAYKPAVVGSVAGLVSAIIYCWQNEAGHSAVNPMLTLVVFAQFVIFGVVGLFLGQETRLPAALVVITGIAGMTFGVFVSKLGILMQYDQWIDAGMPERNPNATALLASFAFATVIGCVVTALLLRRDSAARGL